MPELSNIHTYEKIEGGNYKPTLNKFSKVLQRIELWNEEIKKEFDEFEWIVESDGHIYSSITRLGHFKTKFSEILVRPLVMVYTPAFGASFKDIWMGLDLLVYTEDLRYYEYHTETYNLVKALTFEMYKEFKQTGIYFTDEAQDGQDFDGVRNHNNTKIWEFDYALLPSSLETLYSNPPETHTIKKHTDYIESWYEERWKDNATLKSDF